MTTGIHASPRWFPVGIGFLKAPFFLKREDTTEPVTCQTRAISVRKRGIIGLFIDNAAFVALRRAERGVAATTVGDPAGDFINVTAGHATSTTSSRQRSAPDEPGMLLATVQIKGKVKPGSVGELTMSLENESDQTTAEFTLHAAELVSASGAGIPSDPVSFAPATLSVGPRSSDQVSVKVSVPAKAPPGVYEGLLRTTQLNSSSAPLDRSGASTARPPRRVRRPSPPKVPQARFALVEQCLAEYKDLTMSALLAALPNTEPRGYLNDLVPLYPKRAGKGLPCGLIMATCGAFGRAPAMAHDLRPRAAGRLQKPMVKLLGCTARTTAGPRPRGAGPGARRASPMR